MAAFPDFGQDGPYHKRPGFDQIAQGMGGLMSITGAPGEGPMQIGIPVADLTAGLFCALGILTALLERDVSGQGQRVQTSLLQAQVLMLDFQASRWQMEGDVPQQASNNHPTSIPTGVFKTSDGYINIATTGGKIWERCAQAIGAGLGFAPQLRHRPGPLEKPARAEQRNRTAQCAKYHYALGRYAERCRCSLRPDLQRGSDVRSRTGPAPEPRTGRAQRPEPEDYPGRTAFTLSRTPNSMAARPPEFGERTEEVLAEFGFSADEIFALLKYRVV